MKKTVKSILSLSLVIAMIFTLGIVNVTADSAAHNVTLSATESSGAIGDSVTVSVSLDTSVNISAIGYKLSFDPNVFSIDTVKSTTGNRLMKCINDAGWYAGYKGLDDWQKWGTPTFGADAGAGTITVGYAADFGIEEGDKLENMVIGSFILTVKAGAAAGASSITLIETETMDYGEDLGVAMIFAPITYTVEGATATEYTVTFDENYVGKPANTTALTVDGMVAEPADPTRAGYTFGGWFQDAEGTATAYDFATAFTADTTLYAKWTLIPPTQYTVTFNSNGGSAVAPITGVTSGDTVAQPATPIFAGFTFDGWFTQLSGGTEFDFDTAITANITLFAQWTAIPPTTDPTITIGSKQVKQGYSDFVNVTVDNFPVDVNNLEYGVSFDTDVFEAVSLSIEGTDLTVTSGIVPGTGTIGFGGLLKDATTLSDGEVIGTISFAVKAGAAVDNYDFVIYRAQYGDDLAFETVNGTISVVEDVDPHYTAALIAVKAYEDFDIVTLDDVDEAEDYEADARAAAEDVADEDDKAELIQRIDDKLAVNAGIIAGLEEAAAQAAALIAVEAYEDFEIVTLDDVDEAEDLEDAARDAVDAVGDAGVNAILLGRIEDQLAVNAGIIADLEDAAAKAAALAKLNLAEDAYDITFAFEDLTALGVEDATEDNVNRYHLAVGFAKLLKGSNLVIADIQAVIDAANDDYIQGDINGSDEVSSNDASKVQDAYLDTSLITSIAMAMKADYNKDGKIDDTDVTGILLKVAFDIANG